MTAWRENLKQLMSPIAPGGQGFWTWWRRSLLAWLPLRWQVLLGVAEARLLLWPQADGLQVTRIMQDRLDPIGHVSGPVSVAALEALAGARLSALPRHWLLPPQAALRRRLRLPAAAEARLRDVVGFEIDRQTPFTLQQVYYDVRVCARRDDGQLDVELVVVPKPQIDVLQQATHWGAGLEGVDIADVDGLPLGVNLLPPAQRRQRPRSMQGWNALVLGITALLLVAAALQLLDNRRNAAAALRSAVDASAQRARAVSVQRQQLQALVDGAAFFESQRLARPSTIELWNELSSRLGDGTWLERLSLEGGTMQLVGFSSDAAALVSRLEGSRLWQTPALTGVLQADDTRRRERFTLSAELRPLPKEADDGTAVPSP